MPQVEEGVGDNDTDYGQSNISCESVGQEVSFLRHLIIPDSNIIPELLVKEGGVLQFVKGKLDMRYSLC